MPRFALPGLAAVLFMIAACAGGSGATDAPRGALATPAISSPSEAAASPLGAALSAITIREFEFMPSRLTVHVGDTVAWTNDEDSLHTVSSGTPDARTGLFDSGEFDTGATFEYTFAKVGTYPFFCDRHEFMRGEVNVVP